MFIQTEETPNPAVLKFLPGREIMGEAPPADFPNAETAAASPLAQALFKQPYVESVFLGADFIAVTKSQNAQEGDTPPVWEHIKPQILTAIMDFFVSGLPIMNPPSANDLAAQQDGAPQGENAEIIAAIKQILDTRIRPAVAQDGGDIVFHSYGDGIVYLHMRGACAGCPSATATLQQGVENLLKHFVPVVKEVRPIV